MVPLILLLILAVLLFGSSAVLGALGLLLGFVVAAVALVWASIAFGLDPLTIYAIALAAAAVLFAIGAYCNYKVREQERPFREMLAKMSPEERSKFEKMQSDALAKVRAEMEAKKKYGF